MLNDALIWRKKQPVKCKIYHIIEQDPAYRKSNKELVRLLQLARKHQVKPEDLMEQHKKLKAELTALFGFF